MLKLKLLATALVLALVTSSASADTIIKLGLSGTGGPDVQYVAGVFGTADDGVAGTTGLQNTNSEFTGFLDPLVADILANASFTLAGVTASGAASVVGGVIVSQATTGGTFSLYDPSNVLLLTGVLGNGAITGSTGNSTGSFFNTNNATFTGGSLLAYVATTPAALSLSFTNLLSGNVGAMVVNNGVLGNFVADATGNISGSAVPEPASMALLLSGVLGAAVRKRKAA